MNMAEIWIRIKSEKKSKTFYFLLFLNFFYFKDFETVGPTSQLYVE